MFRKKAAPAKAPIKVSSAPAPVKGSGQTYKLIDKSLRDAFAKLSDAFKDVKATVDSLGALSKKDKAAASDVDSETASAGTVLTADGKGGASFAEIQGGGSAGGAKYSYIHAAAANAGTPLYQNDYFTVSALTGNNATLTSAYDGTIINTQAGGSAWPESVLAKGDTLQVNLTYGIELYGIGGDKQFKAALLIMANENDGSYKDSYLLLQEF